MLHALNMTMPLKQDFQSQRKLDDLKAKFGGEIQQAIGQALGESNIVHFARVLVIDNKYIQVLTEYDGDPIAYAQFFLRALPDVFETIFDLVEDVPQWSELVNNENLFVQVSQSFNLRALGTKDDDKNAGWLFSAFGTHTVEDIKSALAK
ncbi:hypothetical protein [Pseudomonas sp. GL-B-19]|uniref:hypothetical protein n=1 Tax=Pseudomonas sp. GL-B-19 TaxID=2832393 RepID=UPI001CBF4B37|nr:hypothetical protein [Pseudomonas sp. GL-B-19]